jgi:hypothetical protein
MSHAGWRAAVPGFILALVTSSEAPAAFVGDRYFPSTFATVVPTPADFVNFPTFARLPDTATTSEIDIATTFSKLITSDWAVFFTETYRILQLPNTPTRSGFDNLVIGTQYQLYTDPVHEFVITVGGTAAIGGTASSQINAAAYSTFTPTVYIGKGFGDLPDSMAWLRPVNITANVGVAFPTQSTSSTPTTQAGAAFGSLLSTGATTFPETTNPNILLWSFALEYAMLTTSYSGGDRKGIRYVEGWVPLVEFALTTPLNGPLSGQTTGTINPGVIWVGRYLQAGVEAIIPIDSSSGRDIGVRAQAHFYLSEIFPDTIGKPIFGK